jgi:hypothetical protein
VPKARFNDRDAFGLMQLGNNLFMARHCCRRNMQGIEKIILAAEEKIKIFFLLIRKRRFLLHYTCRISLIPISLVIELIWLILNLMNATAHTRRWQMSMALP